MVNYYNVTKTKSFFVCFILTMDKEIRSLQILSIFRKVKQILTVKISLMVFV